MKCPNIKSEQIVAIMVIKLTNMHPACVIYLLEKLEGDDRAVS